MDSVHAMQNFEQIRSHLAAGDFRITMQEPYVMCIELSLDQGRRHQAIFLSEMQDDDGRDYLRVSTAVAPTTGLDARRALRSEEHTSELQSRLHLVCRLLLEKKKSK